MRVTIGQDWACRREALLESLREFAPLFEHRPFDNVQGLRGVSAFALYWFVRRLAPSTIVEVGVWRGFSTWLLEQAAPSAAVHCFDPIFFLEHLIPRWRMGRVYRSPRARYSSQDFSCAPIREIAGGQEDALAFFDDHQDKLPRLRQCAAAGIRHVVFDDNVSARYTHRTLEHERAAAPHLLEELIAEYEIFPALWPVEARFGDLHVREDGLGFPVDRAFRTIHRERQWHSYVTYVRLK
jgi:hypothetical protein